MRVRRWIAWGLLYGMACGLQAAGAGPVAARTITLPVIDHDLSRYERFLAGRSPVDVDRFEDPAMNRQVAELWVFAVAPVLGGCGCRIEYRPYGADTTSARSVADVAAGRQPADAVASFLSDPGRAPQLLLSDAVLKPEEVVVGFYTHRSRSDILGLRSADALRGLRYAVGAHWKVDRQLLEQRGWTQVPADDWHSALRLVKAGRADAILQPFSARADLAMGELGPEAEYVPVPGFRAAFGQARHFLFSASHPDGPWLRQHLNRGLEVLRRSGRLEGLWRASGVLNRQTESWTWVK